MKFKDINKSEKYYNSKGDKLTDAGRGKVAKGAIIGAVLGGPLGAGIGATRQYHKYTNPERAAWQAERDESKKKKRG